MAKSEKAEKTVKEIVKEQIKKLTYRSEGDQKGKVRYTLLSIIDIDYSEEEGLDHHEEMQRQVIAMRELGICEIMLIEEID